MADDRHRLTATRTFATSTGTDMPLPEDRRSQLDEIVMRMEANNEPEDAIRWVVNDFKQKYGNYQDTTSQDSQAEANGGYMQNLAGFVTEDIPNAFKGAAQRTSQRAQRIGAPTVLGSKAQEASGAGGFGGELIEGTAGAPERFGRTFGGAVGTIGEAAGVGVELAAKGVNRLTGNKIGDVIQPVAEAVAQSGPVQRVGRWWESLPEADRANYAATIDMLEAFGMKGDDAVKGAGKKIREKGTDFLGGEMKIKDTLAKRGYGKTIDVKKRNILDNISKYDLESMTGDFSKMASKADNMAIQKVQKADDIIAEIAQSPNAPRGSFVDNVLSEGIDFAETAGALGKKDQARNIIQSIVDDAVAEGMTGETGINKLIEFKRNLDPDGNLFKLGPAANDADNIDRAIRKHLYQRAVATINDIAPEAGKLNKEAKELWDIANVGSDAASRTTNRYAMSLTDRMAGIGAGVGAAGAMATKNPEIAVGTLAAGAAGIGAKHALSQGRGASGIIRVGKSAEALGRTGMPTIGALGAGSIGTRIVNPEEEKEKMKIMQRQSQMIQGR